MEKKTEAVNAYLIKNSKGEGERKKKRGGGGEHSHKQSKDKAELYGCTKRERERDESKFVSKYILVTFITISEVLIEETNIFENLL